jgi:hypothetical protein
MRFKIFGIYPLPDLRSAEFYVSRNSLSAYAEPVTMPAESE